MVGGLIDMSAPSLLQKIISNATLLASSLLFCVSAAVAQVLPDPTRPPAGFVDPDEARNGGGGKPLVGAIGAADPAESGLVLQSVVLPKHGKPVAVISGHYLPLGARIDQWELGKVSEQEVLLVNGTERKVLKLTPQAKKTAPDRPVARPQKLTPRAGKVIEESPSESELKR